MGASAEIHDLALHPQCYTNPEVLFLDQEIKSTKAQRSSGIESKEMKSCTESCAQ